MIIQIIKYNKFVLILTFYYDSTNRKREKFKNTYNIYYLYIYYNKINNNQKNDNFYLLIV